MSTLHVHPLPGDLGPTAVADGAPVRTDLVGAALRCCLRDARVGERVVLVPTAPPGPRGPYAERGPVFVHADACPGPDADGYPEAWRTRRQVFRAYDHEGRITGGEVVDAGRDQEAVALRLLADPAVAFVHTRNVVHGCYMLRLDLGAPGPGHRPDDERESAVSRPRRRTPGSPRG